MVASQRKCYLNPILDESFAAPKLISLHEYLFTQRISSSPSSLLAGYAGLTWLEVGTGDPLSVTELTWLEVGTGDPLSVTGLTWLGVGAGDLWTIDSLDHLDILDFVLRISQ